MEYIITAFIALFTCGVSSVVINDKRKNIEHFKSVVEKNIELTDLKVKELIAMGTSEKEIIDFVIDRVDRLEEKVFTQINLMKEDINKLQIAIAKWVGGAFAASTIISVLVSILT